MKQKTRKQTAAALVVTSAPLLYYGFSNFEAGASQPLEAVAISIGCTGGLSCLIGGIYMLFKNDRGVTLASQNVVGDSSVLKEKPLTPERVAEIKKNNQKAVKEFADKIRKETKEEILKPKEVPPMTTLTPAEKMLKLDELEEDDKALDKMKDTNEKARIEMRAEIKKDGFERNENGIWVPIKKTK